MDTKNSVHGSRVLILYMLEYMLHNKLGGKNIFNE